MKKPETEPKFSQQPAQGGHENEDHSTDVEKEAVAHGTPVVPNPGHGQGGAGH